MDIASTPMMPPVKSTFAGEVDSLFFFILVVGAIFLAIVTFVILFCVIRYRRRVKVGLTSGVDNNLALEILWTAIPTILMLIVFVWGFKGYLKMFVVPRDAMEIKVTGQMWFWSFDYAEGANSINELYVPVDKPIKLLMSSKDVIHSFFVPDFRVKMDVLPNRYTVAWFQAIDTGSFYIFCTEFCGKGHSEMLGKVNVLPRDEFDRWLEAGSSVGEGMSLEEFGAKLYTAKACNTCHRLDGVRSVGPSFMGVFGKTEKLVGGGTVTVDENYIRESLLSPNAKIVQEYQPVMPTYQGLLKDREIDALIAYIKSLK